MEALTVLLVIAAVGLGLWGLNDLTQATLGVGLVALGCLCAILARIQQASAQHAELKKKAQAAAVPVP
jgi:hypothetical protein